MAFLSGNSFCNELRASGRALFRQPGVAIASILTLALGLGLNIAIFTVFNGLLFRPLAVDNSIRLVRLFQRTGTVFSYPEFAHLAAQSRAMAGMAASGRAMAVIKRDDGGSERVPALLVSPNYFAVLGFRAALGRTFTAERDGAPQPESAIMLGRAFWRDRFGADPGILGRTITINSTIFKIAGVAQEGFSGLGGETADIIVPLNFEPLINIGSERLKAQDQNWLVVGGRIRPGTAPAAAEAELNSIASNYAPARAAAPPKRITLSTDILFSPAQRTRAYAAFGLLAGAVLVVLLIACANLVNMLLARALSRRKDFAVQLALGAGRVRVLRQVVIESAILGVCGGLAGLLLSNWALRLLIAGANLPVRIGAGLDSRVFVYSIFISVAAGVLVGIAPAIEASKADVASALRGNDQSSAIGMSRARIRGLLIAGQIAMCFALLVGAGVLLRSFFAAQSVDPGFEVKRLVTVSLRMRLGGYNKARAAALFPALLDRLRSQPGVESVALADSIPYGGFARSRTVEGIDLKESEISPEYFQTAGIHLIGGRGFSAYDANSSPATVVVSESLARRLWPGESPIGKTMRVGAKRDQVVGVVADVRTLDSGARVEQIYRPLTEAGLLDATPIIRVLPSPDSMLLPLEQAVRGVAPELQVSADAIENARDASLASVRSSTALAMALGILALLLAAVGLYGLVLYSVNSRKREIAIRLAMGATRSDILRLVLTRAGKPVIAGIGSGAIISLWIPAVLARMLADARTASPMIFAPVAGVLLITAFLAAYLPTRRATTADPATVLRHE